MRSSKYEFKTNDNALILCSVAHPLQINMSNLHALIYCVCHDKSIEVLILFFSPSVTGMSCGSLIYISGVKFGLTTRELTVIFWTENPTLRRGKG